MWLSRDRFDIVGKLDQAEIEGWNALSPGERRERVRPLLAKMLVERCGLSIHSTISDGPIYGLFLATHKPKLKRSAGDEDLISAGQGVSLSSMGEGDGLVLPFVLGQKSQEKFFSTPMSSLAAFLSAFSDRIVQDRTGLRDKFDFTLPKLDALSDPAVAPGIVAADPQPFTVWDVRAIGLTLKSMKGPIEKWVVDHVDRPVAN